MAGDLLSWFSGDKKTRRRAFTNMAVTAASAAATTPQAAPIMKTIQAATGLLRVGQTINSVNGAASGLAGFLPKATQLVDSANSFVPTMQVMAQSFCDSLKVATQFRMVASAVGIGANVVVTYQGVKALHLIAERLGDISTALHAQTALMAQATFAEYVHDMVRERVGQTTSDPTVEHWFFLWHPDDDWYPKFYHLLERRPVGPAFCGYTNQIDTIFVFMVAARRYVRERERRARDAGREPPRPVRLHLLIPAYQPVLVAEALRIPAEIGDFVMEGRMNSNKELVWLNLPEEQKGYTHGIGQWNPPAVGWWDGVLGRVGLVRQRVVVKEPRVLGSRQQLDDDEAALAMVDDGRKSVEVAMVEGNRSDGDETRRWATPLHQRSQRPKRRRTQLEGGEKEKAKSIQGSRGNSLVRTSSV